MKQFFTFLFLTLFLSVTNAQITTTWIGPSFGGSWSNPSNWDNGVPTITSGGTSYIIVFDGLYLLSGDGIVTITDVQQTNSLAVYKTMRVVNGAKVNLSGSSASYLNFSDSLVINAGCTVTVGGTTPTRFQIGISDLNSVAEINGVLDMQGQGASTDPTIFVASPSGFFGNNAKTTVRGKVILSGTNSRIDILGSPSPVFENGSELNIQRNGGTVIKANYKDGSRIKVEGVTSSPTAFNNDATYDGVVEWDCPNQAISGSSAQILPTITFAYMDSLVITNTGVGRTARLRTVPNNYYIKNLIVNGGTIELGSPTSGTGLSAKIDNIIQNGGTIIGNAVNGIGDGAFSADTINIAGNFIQTGGTFDFSDRTPTNTTPEASCIVKVGGNVKIGATVKLSQPTTAPNCALIFNGTGTQDFEVTGSYINKIKTVIRNSSVATGVNLLSNITLPDSLVFQLGYLRLNDFNLTNPLPVQPVTNPFQTHAVTNGNGFFIQKNVKNAPVGIPIGASNTTVNPLVIGFTTADSIDIGAKVDLGISPSMAFPDKAVDRTWQILPFGPVPSPLAISFGYSNLSPLPGDGNVNFSYTANNEVGLYAGTNWQVISLPGGIAPSGTNPYAVITAIPNLLLPANLPTPLVVANVSGVIPVANLINLTVSKTGNAAALLNWDIAELSEPVSRFEVLRSTDARNFTNIASIAALNNQLTYSFIDNGLQAGINYYRVKMFDASGRFKYSAVVALVNKTSGVVISSFMPTIVKGNATLLISSAERVPVNINITDILGRIVVKSSVVLNQGSNQLNIDCSQLQKGTYQITGYSNGIQTNSFRFVKE